MHVLLAHPHVCSLLTQIRLVLLVKFEIQLLGLLVILLQHLDTNLTDFALYSIEQSAVFEDQLHVGHELLDALILVFFQLGLNS